MDTWSHLRIPSCCCWCGAKVMTVSLRPQIPEHKRKKKFRFQNVCTNFQNIQPGLIFIDLFYFLVQHFRYPWITQWGDKHCCFLLGWLCPMYKQCVQHMFIGHCNMIQLNRSTDLICYRKLLYCHGVYWWIIYESSSHLSKIVNQ